MTEFPDIPGGRMAYDVTGSFKSVAPEGEAQP
jgi:hypothetical protein